MASSKYQWLENVAESERAQARVDATRFLARYYSSPLSKTYDQLPSHGERAMAALMARNFTSALEYATRAIEINERDLDAFHIRAVALAMLGCFSDALKALQTAGECTSTTSYCADAYLLSYYSDAPFSLTLNDTVQHVCESLEFFVQRWIKFFAGMAGDDPNQQRSSLVNLTAACMPGGRYDDIPLYRLSSANLLRQAIDGVLFEMPSKHSKRWSVLGTAVGRLSQLAVHDRTLLDLAKSTLFGLLLHLNRTGIPGPLETSLRGCTQLIAGSIHVDNNERIK